MHKNVLQGLDILCWQQQVCNVLFSIQFHSGCSSYCKERLWISCRTKKHVIHKMKILTIHSMITLTLYRIHVAHSSANEVGLLLFICNLVSVKRKSLPTSTESLSIHIEAMFFIHIPQLVVMLCIKD